MFKLKALFFSCCSAQPNQKEIDLNLIVDPINLKPDASPHLAKLSEAGNKTSHTEPISEAEIINGPKLKMIAIEGTLIPVGTEFKINPGGLVNSERGKLDGETYIGFLKNSKEDGKKVNDIVLEDSSVGNQHCMIKYRPDKKKYFLQDLGEGSGTFIKIEKELELKSGYIISFSDSHMLIHTLDMDITGNPSEDQKEDKKGNISIKFLDGPKVDQVFRFKADDKVIKIGRMPDCQIKFDDNNLSRYQCTFKYVNGAWYIVDGFRMKPSTNGTWHLVDNNIELSHETIVKIGQTLFKIDIEAGTQ